MAYKSYTSLKEQEHSKCYQKVEEERNKEQEQPYTSLEHRVE